jgi:hypothetical protein
MIDRNWFCEIARRKVFGLAFVMVVLLPGVSTAAISEWDRTFGGPDLDHGNSVALASDGGYVTVGTTESYGAGEGDIWLIKTDSSGTKQWDRTFGGVRDEKGASIERTSDGGYIIAGSTYSHGSGAYDFWLIKTDANGNKQWDRTFGGLEYDNASSVQQTSDGGYIIAGHTWSFGPGAYDIWLVKTDAGGNEVWNSTFGGMADDYAHEVRQTSDGGYIVVGSTESYGAGMKDVWLIKTDAGGTQTWDSTFGGGDDDYGKSVQQTGDGGYIIAGTFDSFPSEYESQKMWLIKTDGGGNQQWEKIYGDGRDSGECVRQTSDGGYIMSGSTFVRTDSYPIRDIMDAWVIKTNSEGIIQWDQQFGGDDSDYGMCVRQSGDGEYILAGYTESEGAGEEDAWLVKVLAVDPTTIPEWDRVYGGYGDGESWAVDPTDDGGYVLFGNYSYNKAWLIKTDHNGTRLWDKKFEPVDANYSGYAFGGQQTSDGGYVILGRLTFGGYPPSFAWLIKTDSLGQKEWEATYGGGPYDSCASVQQTSDGGYILTGAKTIRGGMWLIKTDAGGTAQWERIFFPQSHASGSCVRQTGDGGYIITGDDGGYDVLLIKTDQNGIEQWIRRFDRSNVDKGRSVWQTGDGGYVIAGETYFGGADHDIWLIKTDENGTEEWNRAFGGTRAERASAVYQTPDGGYVVAGHTMSFGEWEWDAWVIRTDENGNELWNKIFGGAEDDFAGDVQPTTDGAHIVAGTTYSFNPGDAPDHHSNAWLIKTSDSPCTTYYRDLDRDGYGVPSDFRCLENPIYPYTATRRGDCNDSDPAVNQGAEEILCNGKNDDCNAATPDNENVDGDPVTLCDGDCDDTDPGRYPGNPEVFCNGIDEDCSETTPDDPNDDGDPFSICDGDCDDNDPGVYPGAPELCGDGIDNDCDTLADSDDPDCPDLTGISCLSPPNESILSSSPTFMWSANGGTNNRFAVDLSYDWTFSRYWSTYENMHQPIAAESWAMPQTLWNRIPSGSYVYWRVRGADLAVTPLTIITSDDVWWFYKQ